MFLVVAGRNVVRRRRFLGAATLSALHSLDLVCGHRVKPRQDGPPSSELIGAGEDLLHRGLRGIVGIALRETEACDANRAGMEGAEERSEGVPFAVGESCHERIELRFFLTAHRPMLAVGEVDAMAACRAGMAARRTGVTTIAQVVLGGS